MSNVPPPPPPPPPPGMPPPPPLGSYGAGPVAPSGKPLASPGMRIGARLIEIVIGIVVGFILVAIIVGSKGKAGVGGVGGRYNFGATLGSLAFGWLIEAGLTAWKGGSIGKLILGLRVANASDGATPVSLQTATIRWAVPGAFSIIPILGGIAAFIVFVIGLVFLFTDKLRQTVSDKAARTVVIVK